ncbi:MAG: hypothetical protein R2851_04935 [Caldilineaceae bacterium]
MPFKTIIEPFRIKTGADPADDAEERLAALDAAATTSFCSMPTTFSSICSPTRERGPCPRASGRG